MARSYRVDPVTVSRQLVRVDIRPAVSRHAGGVQAQRLRDRVRAARSSSVRGRSAGKPLICSAVLNRRLARGEIDRAEYDEKRKLIGR